jgi:hypothetical protein
MTLMVLGLALAITMGIQAEKASSLKRVLQMSGSASPLRAS